MQEYLNRLTQLTRSALNPGHNGQTPKETPTMQTTTNLFQRAQTTTLALVALALVAAIPARAATLDWDANTSSSGIQAGNGTWIDGGNNWWNGSANVAWNNATPDSARFGGGAVLTLGGDITVGRITTGWDSSGQTIQNDGVNTYSLTINGTSGTGIEHGGQPFTINVPVVMKSGAGFYRNSAGTMTINGVISEIGGAWSLNTSGGAVYLNGLNTYTGTTVVGGWRATTGNRLYINTLKLKGESQSTGMNNTIQFGFGDGPNQHLIYTGGATTTDKDWRLGTPEAGSFTSGFFNNGSGAVVWQGVQQTVSAGATGARTLILGGANIDDNDWQSVIRNGYATGSNHNTSLSKTGAGKWILSGENTYSGTTTVTQGTLLINGNQSAATGQVTVSADAAIGGNGTIGGSLTLANDAKFWFDPSYTLTVNGGTVNLGNLGIADILNLSATTPDGLYTLLAGSFSIIGGENWGLANAYDFGIDKKIAYFEPGSLVLVVATIPEPASAALLALAGLAALRRRSREA